MEPQKTPHSQNNPEKNKAGGITVSDFELQYRAIVTKIAWYWQKTYTQQQNRIESPEINLHIYGKLIYNKKAKNNIMRMKSPFSKRHWENWIATCKINKWNDVKLKLFCTSNETQNKKTTYWMGEDICKSYPIRG